MLRYQIKTSKTVTEKIAVAGGDDSIAKRILDGLSWRLAHDVNLGTVIDAKRNIRQIKSIKNTPKDPILVMLYRIITGDDPYYDVEITDIFIIP
jgi:hypothetical protein